MAWPKKVPVLVGSDIKRGPSAPYTDCNCLDGWASKVFGKGTVEYQFITASLDLEAALYDAKHGVEPHEDFVEFNDDTRNRKSAVASIWNRVMRGLGYTVHCSR
jgi:hypothetical protein